MVKTLARRLHMGYIFGSLAQELLGFIEGALTMAHILRLGGDCAYGPSLQGDSVRTILGIAAALLCACKSQQVVSPRHDVL